MQEIIRQNLLIHYRFDFNPKVRFRVPPLVNCRQFLYKVHLFGHCLQIALIWYVNLSLIYKLLIYSILITFLAGDLWEELFDTISI